MPGGSEQHHEAGQILDWRVVVEGDGDLTDELAAALGLNGLGTVAANTLTPAVTSEAPAHPATPITMGEGGGDLPQRTPGVPGN